MAASYHLPLPKFTLVGATTRAGQLTAPLRDRFGVVLRLEMYTPEELATIVSRSAKFWELKRIRRERWKSPPVPEEHPESPTGF